MNWRDPLTSSAFWDYTFDNIGKEDVPAFIDAVIANRTGDCNKVQLLTHSSGANSALVAAINAASFSEKVSGITSLAPCLCLDLLEFWNPYEDPASINALFQFLLDNNISGLFTSWHDEYLEEVCPPPTDMLGMICAKDLKPANDDGKCFEGSMKYHLHLNQISFLEKFSEFISTSEKMDELSPGLPV